MEARNVQLEAETGSSGPSGRRWVELYAGHRHQRILVNAQVEHDIVTDEDLHDEGYGALPPIEWSSLVAILNTGPRPCSMPLMSGNGRVD